MGEEDAILVSRLHDAVRAADKRGEARFIGFLDLHQRSLLQKEVEKLGWYCYGFWGGYEQAERVFLGVFPEDSGVQRGFCMENTAEFPLEAVSVVWKSGGLSHRDFLGAVLSLGVERERVGDIVLCKDSAGDAADDGRCVLFAARPVAAFLEQSLARVGGAAVSCERGGAEGLRREDRFLPVRTTVASARLDCAVAALAGVSREKASELIAGGRVFLNFEETARATEKVEENAVVSIRGTGRFVIDRIGPQTRKGRLSFSARKYN